MKKILFVSGVARSGTSALVNVLNANPGFLVGMERYFFRIRREEINVEHFRRNRFLDVQEDDTHKQGLSLAEKGDAFANAVYVGDKFPLLYQNFDYILNTFPDSRQIYIVRNPLSVVESYDARHKDNEDKWQKSWQTGLEEWNASVRAVMQLPVEKLENFYFVQYEEFFGSPKVMNALFKTFGVDELPEARLAPFCEKFEELNARQVDRRDDIRQFVARNAVWADYRNLLERIDQQNG